MMMVLFPLRQLLQEDLTGVVMEELGMVQAIMVVEAEEPLILD